MKNRIPPWIFILLAAIVLLMVASMGRAETVNLAWDPLPVGDSSIAFHVYASLTPGTGYEGINSVKAPATGCVITLPDDGKAHYLIVRGFNGSVESANSNEIAYTTTYKAPPAIPMNVRKKAP